MSTKKCPYTSDPPAEQSNFRDSAGFSLVEVIMVLVIMGIIATIAFPTLSKWIPNYQLRAASRELYANFQKAKLHSVKTNKDVLFSYTNGCPGGSFTFKDEDGVVVASQTMQGGACLASNFSVTSGFNPLGLPTNPLGNVTLTHTKIPGRTYAITQTMAGSVRIQ